MYSYVLYYSCIAIEKVMLPYKKDPLTDTTDEAARRKTKLIYCF